MKTLYEVTSIPKGYKAQKCTKPGCGRKATAVVELFHPDGSLIRYRCQDHAEEAVTNGQGQVLQKTEPRRGKGIYRKREDAYGGWQGWDRKMVI
jgi:hypothetical protein